MHSHPSEALCNLIKFSGYLWILIGNACTQALGSEKTGDELSATSSPNGPDGLRWLKLSEQDQKISGIPTRMIEPGKHRPAIDQDDRWFLAGGGDQAVEIGVSGAQKLLSQELDWQIPDVDEE